jgi:hypothetical protein
VAAIDAAGGKFTATPIVKAKTEPTGRRHQGSGKAKPKVAA